MNINEIIKTSESLLSENKELEDKKLRMQKELLEKVKKNYEKIFMPAIDELLTLDTRLARATEFPRQLITEEPLYRIYSNFTGNFASDFYIVNRANQHDFNDYKNILHRKYPDRDFPIDYKLFLLKEFISENSTLSHLDKIKDSFAGRFATYAGVLREKNEKLSAQIEAIAEQLKESSAIEEKSDGTIEITLNGKTYIGTVKEEE